jgi:phosphoenolpyruvate---glycerone phosphotransferase subunit DhaL
MSEPALATAQRLVKVIAQTAVDNEKYFCDLDAVVGDGDFGYSLARGFENVLSGFDELEYDDAGGLLKKVALVLTKRIGGTSGPIWGTAFLRAGAALSGKPEPTGEDVIVALRAAIEGIKQRGNSDVGDKTLLDALVPAIDSLEKSFGQPIDDGGVTAIQRAADVAVKAAEDTKGMLAMRGRAAYTGERSRDSVDAGATAVGVILTAISAAWRDKHSN